MDNQMKFTTDFLPCHDMNRLERIYLIWYQRVVALLVTSSSCGPSLCCDVEYREHNMLAFVFLCLTANVY